ncbi:PAAR-like protein [Lacrimispora algidixylanolytica]|uniref:DUF4280 domain-containing protein n=1 Tax=Lacrimispora algidixylanolytica TaxID=94868 RepID=A0A419TD03_9FIRM|nr:PAAR-like protein [Lacrimispora algidixylanolytica]RKD35350.1 hypothetical protein BET01_03135 [Lacrimispora algidixylanolytica]
MSQTYHVMEGAVLSCSFGTSESELKVPVSHGPILQGKNKATIADHVGNVTIMPFGQCTKKDPPRPCNPSVSLNCFTNKPIRLCNADVSSISECLHRT